MTGTVFSDLKDAGLRRVSEAEPMERHTSWRIGGPADYFCVVENDAQLRGAVNVALEHRLPWIVLGGGNNILVSDDGIAGIVIANRLGGITVENNEDEPSLRCGAGVFFAKAAHFSARHGYTGLEWGVSIPGTVGAGVVNNAGAHWSDVSRSLIAATVLDAEGRREELQAENLAYRYRQSALKQSHITQTELVVTDCRFRLKKGSAEESLAHIEDLRRHRQQTQPIKEASAGSTFKNPAGEHAGALIDRAGLKGLRIGGAQIAPLHANFILNIEHARASDVLALIRLAQREVADRFSVYLEPEVQFVGRWSEDALRDVLRSAA